jgi:hypothetical protein
VGIKFQKTNKKQKKQQQQRGDSGGTCPEKIEGLYVFIKQFQGRF